MDRIRDRYGTTVKMGHDHAIPLVLLEGHARLTAVFVGGLQRRLTVRAYLGLSPAIRRWGCF